MVRRIVSIVLVFLWVAVAVSAGAADQESSKVAVKASCSREMLQAAADSYVAAQASGDISKWKTQIRSHPECSASGISDADAHQHTAE